VRGRETNGGQKGTELGRPFPQIALPDLDGKRQDILGASASGPAPVACVAIGHSDCGTTRLAIPYLKRMHDRRGPGASVILVLQDDAAAARALLAEFGGDMPVRLEADPYPLAREIGLQTVPTFFLVGPDRRVERVTEGFERAALEETAARLGVQRPFFAAEDEAPALRPG
jgi:hypothetical protein